MPIKKHPIEKYKNYTIYVVTPNHYIAEKVDPSKGVTVTADSLDAVKIEVDKKLDYAASVKINTYEGQLQNEIFQKPFVRIGNPNGVDFDGLAIVITCDYDVDAVIEFVRNRPVRRPKKYTKSRRGFSIIKFVCRNKTIVYEK